MSLEVLELLKLLHYDPATGKFTWKLTSSNRVKVGDEAGYVSKRGYRVIGLNGHSYYAHQLAWLYCWGVWPASELDHIDRDHDNNRINNLRESNRTQQLHNTRKRTDNTSGAKGVSWQSGRWCAYISLNRKKIHLGRYKSFNEAVSARAAGEAHYKEKIHG